MKSNFRCCAHSVGPWRVAAERGVGLNRRCCKSILTFYLRRSETFTMAGAQHFHELQSHRGCSRLFDIRWEDVLTAKRKLEADQVGTKHVTSPYHGCAPLSAMAPVRFACFLPGSQGTSRRHWTNKELLISWLQRLFGEQSHGYLHVTPNTPYFL